MKSIIVDIIRFKSIEHSSGNPYIYSCVSVNPLDHWFDNDKHESIEINNIFIRLAKEIEIKDLINHEKLST